METMWPEGVEAATPAERGNDMEGASMSEAETLHVVEQAMRIRMIWEEVSAAHWGRPSQEVKEALSAAASRWAVPIDERVTTLTAVYIAGGSWE